MPRLRFFRLIRDIDTFGISGTGHIATGCLIARDDQPEHSTEGPVIFTFGTANMAQTTTVTTIANVMKFQCAPVATSYKDEAWHGKPSSRLVWYAADEPHPTCSWSLDLIATITGPCVFTDGSQ